MPTSDDGGDDDDDDGEGDDDDDDDDDEDHLCRHLALAPHCKFAGKSERDLKHFPLSIDKAVS